MNHATKITAAFRIIMVVAALFIVVVTATSFIIPSAFALTRFFNCTTAVANKVGNLTIENVDSCYIKKFPWEVAKANQQHKNNNTTTSVANSNNNNNREKLPLVDTRSSSGNDNYPSSSFTRAITTPMTTGRNLSSDDNYNNSSGSNGDFSAISSDTEHNNSNNSNNDVVSYQNLSRLFQCFQQGAFDGDGLGLNEVASCYTQIFVGNNPPAPTVVSNDSFNNNSNQLPK
jgi:hypothetical protein